MTDWKAVGRPMVPIVLSTHPPAGGCDLGDARRETAGSGASLHPHRESGRDHGSPPRH